MSLRDYTSMTLTSHTHTHAHAVFTEFDLVTEQTEMLNRNISNGVQLDVRMLKQAVTLIASFTIE